METALAVQLLSAIGLAALILRAARIVLSSVGALRAFCLRREIDFTSYGKWAVVTGATDGIGKAYAQQLAKRQMNVVLISRTAAKLRDTAFEIEAAYGVQTKSIVADFTSGHDLYIEIERQMAGFDIGVLVNNVGMTSGHSHVFHDVSERATKYSAMINCNVLSAVEMTKIILPHMLAKKKGIIINVSSAARMFLTPLHAVYSGTKSCLTTFTCALQAEHAAQGIIIQVVEPMYVAGTKLNEQMKPSFFVPLAPAYARSAIDTVGLCSQTTGYFSHWLGSNLALLLPEWFRNRIIRQLTKAELDDILHRKKLHANC